MSQSSSPMKLGRWADPQTDGLQTPASSGLPELPASGMSRISSDAIFLTSDHDCDPSSQADHPHAFTPRSSGFLGGQGRVSADAIRQVARADQPLQCMAQNVSGDSVPDPASSQRFIWGTTINIQDCVHTFRDFLANFCTVHKYKYLRAAELSLSVDQVIDADLGEYDIQPQDVESYYSVHLMWMKETGTSAMNLDCSNLLAYAPTIKLYDQLIKYPHEIISIMDVTLTEYFKDVLCSPQERDESISLSVRPWNLKNCLNLRQLNPGDIDQLISIKGLLIRATPVIPDPKVGFFRCLMCQQIQQVEIDRGRIEEPIRCPNRECNALNTMQIVHNQCVFSSKQVSKLQETPDMIPDGQTPYTVTLNVYDDLVDLVKPGDRIEVTGIYRSMPVRINARQRVIKPVFRTFIDVVHVRTVDPSRIAKDESAIEVNEFVVQDHNPENRLSAQDEEAILAISKRPDVYEYLARSIAPSIFEMEDAKKGVLLQLFGGHHKHCGNARYRGDINVLLVGDPGVAKSQLLQYVHKISPRGIYTSGKGSSAVGLTASVVRDPDTNALVLESGALVLSDGGVCCIDEFDKMTDATRAILHEVMEQQTISIAKAGIITTLNARTSILASANPLKSKFDHDLSLVENINLPPSLLSRFDLLFVILDTPDEHYDRQLATHLVGLYMHDKPQTGSSVEFCPPSLLTKYISYAKSKIRPELDKDAAQELVRLYVEMRALGAESKTVTATTRQLESMIRLAEAHAKVRLSSRVQMVDVHEASRLLREAIKQGATDPKTGRIDMDLLTAGTSSVQRHVMTEFTRIVTSMLEAANGQTIQVATIAGDKRVGALDLSSTDVDRAIAQMCKNGVIQREANNCIRLATSVHQ